MVGPKAGGRVHNDRVGDEVFATAVHALKVKGITVLNLKLKIRSPTLERKAFKGWRETTSFMNEKVRYCKRRVYT